LGRGAEIVGISDGARRSDLAPVVSTLVRGLAQRLDVDLAVPADAVVVLEEYGGTYGVPTPAGAGAPRLAAPAHGVIPRSADAGVRGRHPPRGADRGVDPRSGLHGQGDGRPRRSHSPGPVAGRPDRRLLAYRRPAGAVRVRR